MTDLKDDNSAQKDTTPEYKVLEKLFGNAELDSLRVGVPINF